MILALTVRLGKFVLLLAAMALIAGVSLFVVGSYLTTWPILRLSARSRRTQAMVQTATSLMALAQTFAPDESEKSRPSPPKSAP